MFVPLCSKHTDRYVRTACAAVAVRSRRKSAVCHERGIGFALALSGLSGLGCAVLRIPGFDGQRLLGEASGHVLRQTNKQSSTCLCFSTVSVCRLPI